MGAVRKVEEMLTGIREGEAPTDGDSGTGKTGGSIEIDLADKADKPERPNLDVLRMPLSIGMKDVRFQYAPDSFKLSASSLAFEPGQHIAIVGKSGSGKTTLLHLIAGLLKPTAGEVLVNGYPLAQYTEASWFDHVGYITQHPYIFFPVHLPTILRLGRVGMSPDPKLCRRQRPPGLLLGSRIGAGL